ncbi:MAG: DUF2608 domain-containing protein [Verrucomicrobia bacterium]|nr:DUF2608 domain-containing protein [Verrucomicrobiota bacterium]
MKKLLTALCLIPSLIWGVIIESDKMEAILPHVEEETWVLIDVDNTLIESSLHMGSAQWREHIRKKARSAGFDKAGTEAVLDKFWLFVQPFIPVRLVDPHAVDLIEGLRSSETVVIVLTARDSYESDHTQKQLASVGVSINNSAFPESAVLQSDAISVYEKGVIYCGDNTKSQALLAFMERTGRIPKKVVFIDDKEDQIRGLEKTLEAMGVEFVGIRFSGADERVRSFDPDIADLQFSRLPRIVSDEEAKKLLSR